MYLNSVDICTIIGQFTLEPTHEMYLNKEDEQKKGFELALNLHMRCI